MNYRCYASCAFGIEGILAGELRELGFGNVSAQDARVYFDADEKGIAKANIFLRTADRVYLVLKEFRATTFDDLFEGVAAIPFGDFMSSDARFPVDGNAVRSTLGSVSDVQAITKKAVVTAMQRVYPKERFEENGSMFNLYVNLLKDQVTIALNTSGMGLNRRGYRLKNAQAPLKETLAAALIIISQWRTRDFYDPLCGSGTIAIEAAMRAANNAGSMHRDTAMNSARNLRKCGNMRKAFSDSQRWKFLQAISTAKHLILQGSTHIIWALPSIFVFPEKTYGNSCSLTVPHQ